MTADRSGSRRTYGSEVEEAAEIIKALDRDELAIREAQTRTGITAADFSRIRNADLSTITVDRLESILDHLRPRI